MSPFKNQKGIAQIFILLILLIGLGLGVYLALNPTVFKPKASSISTPNVPETSFELSGKTSVIVGEVFPVDILVRSDIEASNLFDAKFIYPTDKLEIISYQTPNELGYLPISSWIERYFDNGETPLGSGSFVGGLPDPGYLTSFNSPAVKLVTLNFKAKASGPVDILISDGSGIYGNLTNANIISAKKDLHLNISDTAAPSAPLVRYYTLDAKPTDNITMPISAPNSGYAVYGILRDDNGNVIVDHTDFTHSWRIDNPLIATVTPFAACTNGIQSPCPLDHATVRGLSVGTTSFHHTVTKNSDNSVVAEYHYAVRVTAVSPLPSGSPSSSPSASPSGLRGDGNRNNLIEIADMSVLFRYFNKTSGFPQTIDVYPVTNPDGVINTFDFSEMLNILRASRVIR